MNVGEPVLYCSPMHSDREMAAIVTDVLSGGLVNVVIFRPDGNVMMNPPGRIPCRKSKGDRGEDEVFPSGYCYPPCLDATPEAPVVAGDFHGAPTPNPGPLPPGAVVESVVPATPEEIAAAKSGMKKFQKKPPKAGKK